ncbi:MAG: hypothetical protein OXP75_00425 [Rhodospirillales bacterium]|nr:hypothetical protein [Rhodospirillales bacterium]
MAEAGLKWGLKQERSRGSAEPRVQDSEGTQKTTEVGQPVPDRKPERKKGIEGPELELEL